MRSSDGWKDHKAGIETTPTHSRTARPFGVAAQKSGLRVRLNVLLHRRRLDRGLADGLAFDASADHALRARQLVDRAARHRLARSFRLLVSDALMADAENSHDTLTQLASALGPCDQAVIAWREPLLELADRLERPEPISPCGVARALDLLTDGLGPLYNERSERSMSQAIGWVAEGLQRCPPHEWRCPVIMKLDPSHIAWTCSRCGTIGMSNDVAVSPE